MKLFPYVRLALCLAALAIVQESTGQETMQLPAPIQDGMIQSDTPQLVNSVSEETLQDAWAIALMQDPEIEATRWQSSAAQRGLRAARAERLPSIAVNSSYSVFDNALTINAPVPAVPPVLPTPVTASVTVNQREFFLGGVRITQPVYTFGKISSAIDAAG